VFFFFFFLINNIFLIFTKLRVQRINRVLRIGAGTAQPVR